jgi:hypothetical protein
LSKTLKGSIVPMAASVTTDGKQIRKIIAVLDKLVNVIIG